MAMTKRNAYTMRDVARLAGVSISTVSAVVNNKGIVGPELTAVVQKAIAAMNFSPHAGARGLRIGKTNILGLVVQDITNPFFVEALRGVEDEAIKHGYEVLVCNSNDQPDLELRHLNALYTQRVDGVLLATCDSYAARQALVRDRAPIVFIDCVPMKAEVNCVVTDNFDSCYNAIRYLIGLGHERMRSFPAGWCIPPASPASRGAARRCRRPISPYGRSHSARAIHTLRVVIASASRCVNRPIRQRRFLL
jgi:LacI family transcriptional regulator